VGFSFKFGELVEASMREFKIDAKSVDLSSVGTQYAIFLKQ